MAIADPLRSTPRRASRRRAIARVMGDGALYARILARFRNEYAGRWRRSAPPSTSGDLALAQRLVHTLKGAAGMIERACAASAGRPAGSCLRTRVGQPGGTRAPESTCAGAGAARTRAPAGGDALPGTPAAAAARGRGSPARPDRAAGRAARRGRRRRGRPAASKRRQALTARPWARRASARWRRRRMTSISTVRWTRCARRCGRLTDAQREAPRAVSGCIPLLRRNRRRTPCRRSGARCRAVFRNTSTSPSAAGSGADAAAAMAAAADASALAPCPAHFPVWFPRFPPFKHQQAKSTYSKITSVEYRGHEISQAAIRTRHVAFADP